MKYEKPEVEVVKFEEAGFMTASGQYSSGIEALQSACSGFTGATNNFSCGSFGGYTTSNPPQKNKTPVPVGNYVFVYVGKHWKCEVV